MSRTYMIKKNILKVKLFSVFWESFHIFGESLVKQFDCDCVKKRLVVCNKTKTTSCRVKKVVLFL